MKPEKALAQKLNQRFRQKQNELQRIPAVLGDGSGTLYPSGLSGFVYALIGNNVVKVFNNRVVAQYGLKVWVGYASEEPTLFQVLSTRSEAPGASYNASGLGYAPASRYEWLAPGGGQDPLNVHQRALTFLRLSVSASGGMNVNLFRGFVYSGSAYIAVARQDIDLTSYIPSTSGKAALVLITINNTGTVVKTKGSEVDIDALALSDLPAIPGDAVFVCGAVRVYNGQTTVREGRANTDFVDLRFVDLAGGVGGTGIWTLIEHKDADSGAVANFDFTSIPSTFRTLALIMRLRGTDASPQIVKMQYNGDTNTNYTHNVWNRFGGGLAASQTYIRVGYGIASGATANVFGQYQVMIAGYKNTNMQKEALCRDSSPITAAVEGSSGRWANTAAINQITISHVAGNIDQYSFADLYGIS